MKRKPFATVYLHGTVRDARHRKMSKSLGNGIDPIDVVKLYGADALRWTVIGGGSLGADVILDPNDLETTFAPGRNFANKLWNIGRFILAQLPEGVQPIDQFERAGLQLADRWILMRANDAVQVATSYLDQFKLDEAAKRCYEFVWGELADWYVEAVKPRLAGEDAGAAAARARSPQRLRSGKRDDQAPRPGRGTHLRRRHEGPRRIRGLRRRQRSVRRPGGRDRRAAGMQAPVGRSDAARRPAGRARGQAHQPGLRRARARRRGRERARQGASVAGAAPGTRRQAHGTGLLIALALAACAKLGDPPGGPPDTTPPTVVAVRPESGAVVPDFHGDAVVQFDEVIDEMAGGTGGGAGGGGGGGARSEERRGGKEW